MLAMLLEMTWTLSYWAIIPVAAVCKARMWNLLVLRLSRRNLGEALDGAAPHVALLLQQAGNLGVAARDLDHARHLDYGAHVGFLDRPLRDAGLRRRLRLHAGRGEEQARAVLLQSLDRVEADDAQFAAR